MQAAWEVVASPVASSSAHSPTSCPSHDWSALASSQSSGSTCSCSSDSSDSTEEAEAAVPAADPSKLSSFVVAHGLPHTPVLAAVARAACRPPDKVPEDKQTADMLEEFLGEHRPHAKGDAGMQVALATHLLNVGGHATPGIHIFNLGPTVCPTTLHGGIQIPCTRAEIRVRCYQIQAVGLCGSPAPLSWRYGCCGNKRLQGTIVAAQLLGMSKNQFSPNFVALAAASLICSRCWLSSFATFMLHRVERGELVPHVWVDFFMGDETTLTSGGHYWRPGGKLKVKSHPDQTVAGNLLQHDQGTAHGDTRHGDLAGPWPSHGPAMARP
jgi:hypothetical protein